MRAFLHWIWCLIVVTTSRQYRNAQSLRVHNTFWKFGHYITSGFLDHLRIVTSFVLFPQGNVGSVMLLFQWSDSFFTVFFQPFDGYENYDQCQEI